jgi:hypothetical protein
LAGAELDCPVVLLVRSKRPMLMKKPVINKRARNARITQRRSSLASDDGGL